MSESAAPASDVATALRARLAAVTSGEERISGTLLVGDVQATFEGTRRTNGPDSSAVMSTTVGGVVSNEERAKVAGVRFVRRGDGPWLADTAPERDDALDAAYEDALASVQDLDLGTSGSAPHRLVADAQAFDPVRYGFAAAGQGQPGTATFTFLASPDGTPISIAVEATWTARSNGASVNGSLTLMVEFVRLDSRPSIAPPREVWKLYSSTRFEYAYAVPPTFEPNGTKDYDAFIGPTASGYVVSSRAPSRGQVLNTIAEAELTALKTQLGATDATSEVITLGGEQARLLSVSGRASQLGGRVTMYEAVAVKGKHFYVVALIVPHEGARSALAMARQLLATFSFTG